MAGEWLVRLANFDNLNVVLLLNFIFMSENHITVVAVDYNVYNVYNVLSTRHCLVSTTTPCLQDNGAGQHLARLLRSQAGET